MLRLNSIELTNFRSFKGTHRFEFPKSSGLYFLKGENCVDDLGANGAGKSTFLDAIVWCLYGRTARGLKANEIITWDTTGGCAVTLDLTIGEPFQVKRTQKPNNLTIDGKPVDQIELEKHLRLNFEAFLHSVLNAQFGKPFFSLTPSAKLELFSEIMNLDFWLSASNMADIKSKELDRTIFGHQYMIEKDEGYKKSILDDLKDLKIKEADFNAELAKTEKVAKFLKRDLTEEEKELKRLEFETLGFERVVTRTTHTRDQILEAVQLASEAKAEFKHQIKVTEKKIKEYNLNIKDSCPMCRQRVNRSHINGIINDLEDNIYSYKKEIELEELEIKALMPQLGKAKLAFESAVSDVNRHKEYIIKSDKKITILTTKLEALDKRRENPYSSMIKTKNEALQKATASITKLTSEIEDLEQRHAATSYWVKGFKQIRLFIIEQAFQSLELEVNSSLALLGMPDWQITFDIERENKSGGITKGFVVFVKNPHNKEAVKWENWSGGETQRLQLAGDLGLANLIMQQAGLTNTIEIFDEPSTHLSNEGMLDLANLLYERAVNDEKCIWIVDHTTITNFGDFTGTITVRKTENGSELSTEEPENSN